jgi:spore coat protein U-like protein
MQSFTRHFVVIAFAIATGPAFAATVTEPLTVSGTLVAACEVTGTPLLTFAALPPLASSAPAISDTGASLQVACSAGLTPSLYVTGTRAMVNGGATVSIPFNLSLTAGAIADDLPATPEGNLVITQDGTAQTVTIYGRVLAASSQGQAAGTYTSAGLAVNVDY